ncbi:MAG: YIP1 family protein [Chitinivibrionia bacterium]|nr:YIP1 family protein [Chitinivibrionia bacterium]
MLEKYISIIWAIIKNPYEYFSAEMPKGNSVKDALIFAMIIGSLAFFAFMVVSAPTASMQEIAWAAKISLLIFMPALIVMNLYVSAFFVHLAIFFFVPKRSNFKQTLKVIAYSNATSVLLVVPVIGVFLAAIFNIRAFIFGISAVHNVSALKVFMFFVILPIIILAIFITMVIVLLGATFATLMEQSTLPW